MNGYADAGSTTTATAPNGGGRSAKSKIRSYLDEVLEQREERRRKKKRKKGNGQNQGSEGVTGNGIADT